MIPRRPSYEGISLYSQPAVYCRVDLSDNTSPFGMPPAAERALRECSTSAVSRYPLPYAPDLKKALSSYTGFEPSWLTTGCGSDDLIDCSMRAFLEPGERIAVPDPSFSMLAYFAKVNGLQFVPVPLRPDFDIDVDGLLATGARLIYVCTPNNPTSTPVSRAALERLVDAAPGIVLVDEAYAEFSTHAHSLHHRLWPHRDRDGGKLGAAGPGGTHVRLIGDPRRSKLYATNVNHLVRPMTIHF